MKAFAQALAVLAALALPAGFVYADVYSDTVSLFKDAGASAHFFQNCYGYAVFPTIGKGGFGVGAAHGEGRLYKHGAYIGTTGMTQVSFGFQFGGQAYSEILFFKDADAFARFESGKFALSADANAVAVTASASASAGTNGSTAGASAADNNARTAGRYQDGVAVFTIAKGGLMYEAAVAGQRFTFKPGGRQ